ncbi:MAG: lipopolysaccharide biosynthesis protein [Muribaculaceae bacterium]
MTTSKSTNNKRIAKNTMLLYVRMLLLVAVNLYTSRIVLEALGVSDFGVYNVVGGVVAMFALLSGSLSAAISRYITYELGTGNKERLNLIFSTSVNILIIMSVAVIILAETVGLWFLNVKMVFPPGRLAAANWVFQLSMLTFVINLISIPYNAAIISHEKMSAFAYISILEAFGKLGIAFLVMLSVPDKLVFYAVLMCLLAIAVRVVYVRYCKGHFSECTYHLMIDRPLLKEMFGFAGWNFIGAGSVVLRNQGGNIVINLFYGTVVNAACGIAVQVNNAITGFVTNFMTALNPQITKYYASGEYQYMTTLIFNGARLSFYLLLLISVPVLLNTHYLLSLWLTTVPEYTALFVQLTLVFAMSESISNPLITVTLATGNIRNYQIIVGGLQMLNLPIVYVLLRNGFAPQWVYIVAIIISQACLAARLVLLRRMIDLDVRRYMTKVYLNVIAVGVCAMVIPACMRMALTENFVNFVMISLVSLVCTAISIYYVGCTREQRAFVVEKCRKIARDKGLLRKDIQ